MSRIVRLWRREPVRLLGLVQAAILVAVSLGIDLSAEQQASVIAFAAALLGVGEVARSRVSPV